MGKIESSDKFESNVVQKSFFEEISLRWLGILFQDNGRNKKENALKTILMRTGFRGCRSVVEYILTRMERKLLQFMTFLIYWTLFQH